MDNDFVKGMEILINCKHLVEEIIAEKKHIVQMLVESGKYEQAHKIQLQINRYQRVLDGEPLHRHEY